MIKQIILAFLGSVFPVILFNIDRKKIIWTGFCGAIGWAVYLLTYSCYKSSIGACLTGAFAVGVYSEIMARKLKTPAIVLSIPGSFPLVPGITAYNTIYHVVMHEYTKAISMGVQTIAAGGAIGFGLMLSSSLFRYISKNKRKKKRPVMEDNF